MMCYEPRLGKIEVVRLWMVLTYVFSSPQADQLCLTPTDLQENDRYPSPELDVPPAP